MPTSPAEPGCIPVQGTGGAGLSRPPPLPRETPNPGKNFRAIGPPPLHPLRGRFAERPLVARAPARQLGRSFLEPGLGHAMATLLESARLIVRSQLSSRDGRVHAVAEDSTNGHLRKGRPPRTHLAG